MRNKIKIVTLFIMVAVLFSFIAFAKSKQKEKIQENSKDKNIVVKENKSKTAAIKSDTVKTKQASIPTLDSLPTNENLKFKAFKKSAHASYYAARFEGKRTASGKRFSNKAYTAAHKKLPFGTKVRVTNEANGKSVVVEITDRGPFSKVREIDLTKKAFMEIASNKNSGSVLVKLEDAEN